jgi:hypothetical protein
MAETQHISAKVHVPGKSDSQLRIPLTLKRVSEWIRLQGFDEYTTDGLIKIASRYPDSALNHFRRNFNLMIQRVRAQRKLEQRGDEENADYTEEKTDLEAATQKVIGRKVKKDEEVVDFGEV